MCVCGGVTRGRAGVQRIIGIYIQEREKRARERGACARAHGGASEERETTPCGARTRRLLPLYIIPLYTVPTYPVYLYRTRGLRGKEKSCEVLFSLFALF